ncbi:MAG: HAD hydrolase-like protein [Nanohaloarchaea archaeon]|nr:HAD hydrolase-like protein [Candidatus Nanohaloarchaea archaeon]
MELHEQLEEIKYFFLDLDKTLWNWDDTIIGAEDLVHSLRQRDRQVYFHTDNTLLTREQYAKKLTGMNIGAEPEQVLTAGHSTGLKLEKDNVNKAYVIGESGLIEELERHDVKMTDEAENVVMGFDRQFSYRKTRKAMKILEDGGKLYVCSNEQVFRTSKVKQPHQGLFNAGFRRYDPVLTGKPGEAYIDAFQDYFDFFPDRSLLVGDRLADVELGNRLGMKTGAVMSGDITREKLKRADDVQKPDFGISSLNKLRTKFV